jgi:predicted DNA-binding transcriptional regulator AlpA
MEALLVSVTETRPLLGGISRTTFYELIKAGYLKPVKIGRRTFLRIDSIRAFLKAREV